jgi:hypothetical protein
MAAQVTIPQTIAAISGLTLIVIVTTRLRVGPSWTSPSARHSAARRAAMIWSAVRPVSSAI